MHTHFWYYEWYVTTLIIEQIKFIEIQFHHNLKLDQLIAALKLINLLIHI